MLLQAGGRPPRSSVTRAGRRPDRRSQISSRGELDHVRRHATTRTRLLRDRAARAAHILPPRCSRRRSSRSPRRAGARRRPPRSRPRRGASPRAARARATLVGRSRLLLLVAGLSAPSVPRGDTAGAVLLLRTCASRSATATARGREPPRRARETVALVGANGCASPRPARGRGMARRGRGDLLVAHRADVGYLEQTAVSGSRRTVAEEARSRMTTSRTRGAARGRGGASRRGGEARRRASSRAGRVGRRRRRRRRAPRRGRPRRPRLRARGVGPPVRRPSGGWQMRVALARSSSPGGGPKAPVGHFGVLRILLLDEPTTTSTRARKPGSRGGSARTRAPCSWCPTTRRSWRAPPEGPRSSTASSRFAPRSCTRSGGYRDFRRRASRGEERRSEPPTRRRRRRRSLSGSSRRTARGRRRRRRRGAARNSWRRAHRPGGARGGDGDGGRARGGPGDRKRVSLTLPPAPAGARRRSR